MKRDRFVQQKLEQAKSLFCHYFDLALPDGLESDGYSEIGAAVDELFEAAVQQAKLELSQKAEPTKREYFAALALQGQLAALSRDDLTSDWGRGPGPSIAAENAIFAADALLLGLLESDARFEKTRLEVLQEVEGGAQ